MGILKRDSIEAQVSAAVAELKAGRLIVLTDHEDRENEGDLVCLAELASAETIDYMTRKGRGLICATLGRDLVDRIGLMPSTGRNSSPFDTPFTESVDARCGCTTGISAAERAVTLRKLADPSASREDFTMPGHIFPLAAHPRGLMGREGHTEGGMELARLAGAQPAAVICEILGEDGDMARGGELARFAREEGLVSLAMETLHAYLYHPVETVKMPLPQGDFSLLLYPKTAGDTESPIVLVSPRKTEGPVPVRIHSSCATGDLFGSRRCDCGDQLKRGLEIIGAEGGALVYLSQEGRGIGLADKIRAYRLQEAGMDTVEANLALGHPADARSYLTAGRILRDLGLEEIALLTNNPLKLAAMEALGFSATRRPLEAKPGFHNEKYLTTKKDRMGHLLSL